MTLVNNNVYEYGMVSILILKKMMLIYRLGSLKRNQANAW